VRTGGEEFGNAGSFETCLSKAEGSPKACSSCTYNNGIICVVNNRVVANSACSNNTVGLASV